LFYNQKMNKGKLDDRVAIAQMVKEHQAKRSQEQWARSIKNQLEQNVGADVAVSQPLSREESQSLKQETMNAYWATQECAPYVKEARGIRARMVDVANEIDNITSELAKLRAPSRKLKEDVVTMRHLYATERLQKQEELIRHRDRLLKIREIINDILKKYEDKRSVTGVLFSHFMNGGTACKCKRSLKYKRRSLKDKRRSLKDKRRSLK
jgi:hypothetical protein